MLPRKNPYTFFDEFVLRTATFSFKLYHELGDKKKIRKKELLSIWNRPECKEALFLASPDFYSICEHFFNDVNNHYNERVEQSLLKYTARMCSRATPFGLFAGITTGKISENTAIELSKTTAFKRKSRLDMSFILALSQQLSKQESLQRQLRFFLNSSLYKTADHYRYVEYTVKETERHYSLEGIESTAHLEKILLEARKGKTISALAKSLVSEEIAFQEATHYIKMLIDHQVLVSELEIQLTGEDNLTVLIAFLNLLENTTAYQRTLKTIEQLLSKLDEKVGNEVSQYNTLYQLLGKTEIAYKKQQSIQTDLFVQCTSNTLSKKVAYTVQNALTVLNKLNPVQEHKNLIAFKKAFWERYETREVPLTTVLDIESGIGYGHDQVKKGITPFLDDIQLPKSQPIEKEEISTHPVAIYLE